MKFSLLKNDKSTAKDELALFGLIMVFGVIGILIFIKAPSFWIVNAMITKIFGLACVIFSAMLIPGLIYRLITNDK